MQPQRIAMTLGTPAVIIAVGLLSGPAGFGPGEPSAEAALLSEVRKLLASDAQAIDEFGWSVAVSGDTAVVGARSEDAGGSAAGAAYVFGRDDGRTGNWGEVKKLLASDAQSGDLFGGSVAVSGDTVVVGAIFEDAGGLHAGAAYVFGRDEGGADNWGEVSKLTASDAQAEDFFGFSVAVSGDTAVVGAPRTETGRTGAAYVFQRDQGGAGDWGELSKLTASDAQANDEFGYSVAVSGDTAFVGAPTENTGGLVAGAAYVFRRNQGGAGNWGEVTKLTASDAQAGDEFGFSVAVSGDTAVVGAWAEDAGGTNAGAAYVFGRDQGAGNWSEVTKLLASDAQASDEFGVSVAISADTAVVGAFLKNAGGSDAGAAYVFGRDQGGAGNWSEVTKLTASDAQAFDQFGQGVALSGDTAVVGAWHEDAGGLHAGAAYVFQESAPTPTPTPGPTKQPDPGDTDGDGCSDAQENGPNEALGGRRDYLSFWDFFDVPVGGLPRNHAVDAFDIGAVVLRFGAFVDPPPTKEEALAQALMPPADATSYHAAYDRGGPIPGQNLWNLLPPNGPIDAFDIGAVVVQFGHTCVAPP